MILREPSSHYIPDLLSIILAEQGCFFPNYSLGSILRDQKPFKNGVMYHISHRLLEKEQDRRGFSRCVCYVKGTDACGRSRAQEPSRFSGRPKLPGYKLEEKGRNILIYYK